MPVLMGAQLMQAVFRVPAELDKQLVSFCKDRKQYEPLEAPQNLDAGQLAMLLPAAIAMQACALFMAFSPEAWRTGEAKILQCDLLKLPSHSPAQLLVWQDVWGNC